MDYTVHGILQARILAWVSHSSLQRIFPTQGLNLDLLHCRQIRYHLSHQGSPMFGTQQMSIWSPGWRLCACEVIVDLRVGEF